MAERPRKLRRDSNGRAFEIVRLATDESQSPKDAPKNPPALAVGKLGGLRGGKARAASMTKKERIEAAKSAARARRKSPKPG
jgi:hypothetical protein